MLEYRQFDIPAEGVRSLEWHGDVLVDRTGTRQGYALDGLSQRLGVIWSYRFDAVTTSRDGRYAVLYERLGTKGLLLREGKIVREINRSFYHANAYEYPVVVGRLSNGRDVLIHCPEHYNVLEIEDLEKGEPLTRRQTKSPDFFHSRLQLDERGRYLMSAGWIWHPIDWLGFYDLEAVLENPSLLDANPIVNDALDVDEGEVSAAVFVGADIIVSHRSYGGEVNLSRYALPSFTRLHTVSLETPTGTMHAFGSALLCLYKRPRLIDPLSGRTLLEWPDLETGVQESSIIRHLDPLPPVAVDAPNRRFAVASESQITVIDLS